MSGPLPGTRARGSAASAEVGHQGFDQDAGDAGPQGSDDRGELKGAAVGQVVARHRGGPRRTSGRGRRPLRRTWEGSSGDRGAGVPPWKTAQKAAIPRADVTQDEEGRPFSSPTSTPVRLRHWALRQIVCNPCFPKQGRKPRSTPHGRGTWTFSQSGLRVDSMGSGDDSSIIEGLFSRFIRRRIRFRAWACFMRFFSPGLEIDGMLS